MSGKKSRQRRRAAATPGSTWTATQAAQWATGIRDQIVDRYLDNPVLTIVAARSHQAGIADLLVRRGHGKRDAHDPQLLAAIENAHLEITGEKCGTVPPIPADETAAIDEVSRQHSRDLPPNAHLRAGRLKNRQSVAVLRAAELYVASPAMHAAIMAAAQTLTSDDLRTCCEADVLASAGALFLPYSQPVRPAESRERGLSLLTWQLRGRVMSTGGTARSLQVEGWTDERPAGIIREATAVGHPLPRLLRSSSSWITLNTVPSEGEAAASSSTTVRLGTDTADASDDSTHQVVGKFSCETVDDPGGDLELRYLFAFMRLAAQQIATMSRPPTMHDNDHPGTRSHENVRVVHLRSADPQRPTGESGPAREYKHRHVVRMHKVKQWYPSEQRHKVIWRGPYIRGPEGAPLLAGEKVQALVR